MGNEDEDAVKRGTWGGKLDFILSTMGYSIGLGNVWRFPYLCYSNGGGAFLFPYLIMLVVVGYPLMFLEMSFGQFSSLGCISIWRISPLFKGLGFGMVLISGYFCLYYNIIISYAVYYMFASFLNPLPWVGCNHTDFNTANCFDGSQQAEGVKTCPLQPNYTVKDNIVFSSEEYFERRVLQLTDSIDNVGTIQWEILLCFILVWIVVFLCISKGVRTSGKVVYFTATFPYLGLVTLLIVGALQPGAVNGILYFITPQFDKLLDIQVWRAAANQVVFSFAIGWGGLQTLSSYNKFHNNIFRDSTIVIVCGGLTSIFAGFVVFSIIGFMACDAGVPIDKAIKAGPGLAFVAYPEAISRLPAVPQLWSFIFFFMLITLGLDSQFVTLETVITATMDEMAGFFPGIRKRKTLVIFIVCLTMLLLGLPFTTQGGIYVMTLFDWYSAGYTPLILALIELLVFDFVYGLDRFLKEIGVMTGSRPSFFWKIMWYLITPDVIKVLIFFGFLTFTPAQYGAYIFPDWANILGWCMTGSSLVCIVVYAVYFLIFKAEGFPLQRLRDAVKPSPEWGPALDEDRATAGYPPLHHKTTTTVNEIYQNVGFNAN